MHSLTICFGPNGTIWNLLFKTEARATSAYAEIVKAVRAHSGVSDDFGQTIFIPPGDSLVGVLLEDLDQSQLGQIERGLHNARSQAKAQQRAMSDPTIKTAAMAQGPAVLNGGMPRFS